MYSNSPVTGNETAAREPLVLGGWSMLGDPLSIEALAQAGFDFVGLDVQHGFFGFDSTVRAIQQLDALRVPALVRISRREIDRLPRYLDAGAAGAIIAMVTGPEDAELAVRLSRYQPKGDRSYGGQRYGLRPEPADVADVQPRIYVMIETAEAARRVNEIAVVPQISGLYVGPVDLGLALGVPADRTDQDFVGALNQVISAAHSQRIQAGMFSSSGADARELAGMGFDEVVISSDIALLRASMNEELAAARKHIEV